MAFGAEMVDARGPTFDHPAASSITGLLANALGCVRHDRAAHQRLQDRLVLGARLDRPGQRVRDFQTVRMAKADAGWTTFGHKETRAGGAQSYNAPHIRERDYLADAAVTVALRLDPADEAPNLDALAAALTRPARLLFLGRKPCLPAGPVLMNVAVEAPTVLDALASVPLITLDAHDTRRAAPAGTTVVISEAEAAAAQSPHRRINATERTTRRDWMSGVHAGLETLVFVSLARDVFPTAGEV